MDSGKKVVTHVANVTGVPSSTPSAITSVKIPILKPITPVKPLVEAPKALVKPTLKRIIINKECGDLTRAGYIYKAMTNLGDKASQLKYDVMLRTPKGVDELQKVENTQTTPEGGISCTIPKLVDIATISPISESKGTLPKYPLTGSKVYIKWEEQLIGEDTYGKGRSAGITLRYPRVHPKPVRPTPPIKTPPVTPPKTPRRPVVPPSVRPVPKERAGIARREKRKVSVRAEEIMTKRSFPKAVKEAIEKGLERKDAPRDIEQIIEKVAKTNEPNYILRRTIAKRMARGGTVQYKVDTDKGTIVYENADENSANAILGMKTPTGEIIPLQIKVIK